MKKIKLDFLPCFILPPLMWEINNSLTFILTLFGAGVLIFIIVKFLYFLAKKRGLVFAAFRAPIVILASFILYYLSDCFLNELTDWYLLSAAALFILIAADIFILAKKKGWFVYFIIGLLIALSIGAAILTIKKVREPKTLGSPTRGTSVPSWGYDMGCEPQKLW